jgi:hypothetical protein
METSLEAYRDQIEKWMETVCAVTFGETEYDGPQCPKT